MAKHIDKAPPFFKGDVEAWITRAYQYLEKLHKDVYGVANIQGVLDDENISYTFITGGDLTISGDWTITGTMTFSTHPLGLDHGQIGGLTDDDHTQYWIEGTARTGDFETSGVVSGYSRDLLRYSLMVHE